MDSGLCQKRINVNGDRLSALPDALIHKIFSSFDIKHVIETSVLSSRWRYIWTSMPCLNFSTNGFPSLLNFTKFVTHVLSRLNNKIDVPSVKLSFRGKASQVFVKRILKYAFSHNVQHMTITYLHRKSIEFPLSLFTSHSLKHLTLSGANKYDPITLTSSTWELPALTTLHLEFIIFDHVITDKCVGLFPKCINLKNLTLDHCKIMGSDGFIICHPQLCNLTFKNERRDLRNVNVVVVAPQLKNMSIALNCFHSFQFFSDSLPSLEKVDLRLSELHRRDAHKIVGLLQQFHSVKFLTLNLEIIEALTSIRELLLNQPSPFPNLKSLKIYPVNIHSWIDPQPEGNVSTIVKNYLLDSSAEPTLTMVSYEEMRDINNATLAQKRMEELRVLLDEEKENSNRAHAGRRKTPKPSHKGKLKLHEQGKAQVENQGEQLATELPLHIRGRMEKIESCWGNLSRMFLHENTTVFHIFSDLEAIERLLKELPESKRVMLQSCFSSLCADADITMNKYTDRMKIQCDTKISRLSV